MLCHTSKEFIEIRQYNFRRWCWPRVLQRRIDECHSHHSNECKWPVLWCHASCQRVDSRIRTETQQIENLNEKEFNQLTIHPLDALSVTALLVFMVDSSDFQALRSQKCTTPPPLPTVTMLPLKDTDRTFWPLPLEGIFLIC